MVKSLFTNGRILASFSPLKEYGWILVENGMVSLLGAKEEIPEIEGSYETVDLEGKTVLPGFIDAHMHLDSFGVSLNVVDLVGVTSIKEIKEKISSSTGISDWLLAHGWDEHLFSEGRMPTKHDIDEVVSDRPVFMSRVDLHSGLLNSKGLETLGLKEKFGNSVNLVKSEGELTGIVKEDVFEHVKRRVNEICLSDPKSSVLEDAVRELAKCGVTSVGFMCCSLHVLNLLSDLRKKGKLNVRVHAYLNADELENFKSFANDDLLEVTGVKLFSDGSFGTKTALLSFPYEDDKESYGDEITSVEIMIHLSRLAESKGLDVAVHAIGDKALDNVLESFSHLNERHRVDHVALVRKDQIGKISKVNPILVVQPHFIITDFWVLDRLGKQRAGIIYPFKSLLDREFELSLSTDCPVERINPWETVYAAITRGSGDGIPLGVVTQSERLTLEQSLRAYTEGSAHALRDKKIGSLMKGLKADFIVVDTDPFEIELQDVRKIKVLHTYVNGKCIY